MAFNRARIQASSQPARAATLAPEWSQRNPFLALHPHASPGLIRQQSYPSRMAWGTLVGPRVTGYYATDVPSAIYTDRAYLDFSGGDRVLMDEGNKGAQGININQTLLIGLRFTSVAATSQSLIGWLSNFNGNNITYGRGLVLDGGVIKAVGSNQNNKIISSGITAVTGVDYIIAARFGVAGALAVNGIIVGTGDTSYGWSYSFGIGGGLADTVYSPTYRATAHIFAVMGFNTGLTNTELAALTRNPWQIFSSDRRVVYFDLGAGGAYTLASDAGSFTLSGQTASLLSDRKVTADTGAYSLSGQSASLLKGYLLAGDPATFTLSGQAATLLKGYLLSGDTGTFTLTGQDATLTYTPNANAYTLTCDAGTFSLTGQDANLLTARVLSGDAGTYSLTGQNADLLKGYVLAGEPATLTLTGQAANLLKGYLLSGAFGAYTLTGHDATLTYTPNANAYTLTCAAGTFVLAGQDATLLTNRILSSGAGTYTLTGEDVGLLAGRKVTADVGNFSLTGIAAGLLKGYYLNGEAGTFTLAGQNANLVYTPVGAYILTANSGVFSVAGQDASLLYNRILSGSAGPFAVTGIDAGLLRGLKVFADAGDFTLAGQNATLTYIKGYVLTCDSGTYVLDGQDAALLTQRILAAGAGGYTLTGKDAVLETGTASEALIGDPQWQICIKATDRRVIVEGFTHSIKIH